MAYNISAELAFGKVYERIAAEVVAEKLWPGCQLVATKGFADIDFIVTMPREGQPAEHLAFLETKARRISVNAYERTIVANRKYDAARWAASSTKFRLFAWCCSSTR